MMADPDPTDLSPPQRAMRQNLSAALCCSFCKTLHDDIPETDLLHVADSLAAIQRPPIPAICSRCLSVFSVIEDAHRKSPKLAAALIEALNAEVDIEAAIERAAAK